jgi:hypothetical protein
LSRYRVFAWVIAASLLLARAASAATISFSEASNGFPRTDWLKATLTYTLPTPLQLDLSVRNDTTADAPFDITLIFFNTGPAVSYLQLVEAWSSVEGANTDAWRLGYYGYDLVTPTFGDFDHSLRTDPRAPHAHSIAPGETQHFRLSVSCASYLGCGGDVLNGWSENRRVSASAALFFERGPEGLAAFGARVTAIPEPHSAALLGLGLAALSAARARRPGARAPLSRRSPRAA